MSESERAELAQLRKDSAELRMLRDVLKRAAAVWVDEAMGGGDGPVPRLGAGHGWRRVVGLALVSSTTPS